MSDLSDRTILIVEDELVIALDLATTLERRGAHVIGPATTIAAALALIDGSRRIDAAVLDINLRDELVFPVADALRDRNVPYVFATGYGEDIIPTVHRDVARHEKPVDPEAVARALLP
jgi:CheY-like chemotaxis protein